MLFKRDVFNLAVQYVDEIRLLKDVKPNECNMSTLKTNIIEKVFPEKEELKGRLFFLTYDLYFGSIVSKHKVYCDDDIKTMFQTCPKEIKMYVNYYGDDEPEKTGEFNDNIAETEFATNQDPISQVTEDGCNYTEELGCDHSDDGLAGDFELDDEFIFATDNENENLNVADMPSLFSDEVPVQRATNENENENENESTGTEFDDNSDSILSSYGSDDHCEALNDSYSDFVDDPMRGWSDIGEVQIPPNPSDEFNLGLKAIFLDVYDFRKKLQEYVIRAGIKIHRKKNGKKRMIVECRNCNWNLHAGLMPDGTTFIIKRGVTVHTCVRVDCLKEASSNWIAEKLVTIMRDNLDMKNKALMTELAKLGVRPKYMQLYRAKLKALDIIEGNPADSYKLLPRYAAMIEQTNPGSVVKFQYKLDKNGNIPREPIFKRFFWGFEALKRGFLEGCQPFIGLDGCHLKGKFGGILLSACGLDANMGLYPIAFAVVENENTESWGFFLTALSNMLGGFAGNKPWTFMTDRQKGLIEALDDCAPDAVHRKCCRHIYANLRGKHPGVLVKKLFWAAARAYTVHGFSRAIARLDEVKPAALDYLSQMGDPDIWARHAFNPELKNDHITNNISESLNAWLGELRGMPIAKLADGIKAKIMSRLHIRSERALSKWTTKCCAKVVKQLNTVKEEAIKCKILVGGTYEFQINDPPNHYIVDLRRWHCDCRVWNISGIPCKHAAAAIAHKRHDIEDYVHHAYYRETFIRGYSHKIYPIPDSEFWPEMGDIEPKIIHPPENHRRPGRPKKHRKRELGEEPRVIPKAPRGNIKCSTCGEKGHNKRGCPIRSQPSTSARGRAPAAGRERGRQPATVASTSGTSNAASNMPSTSATTGQMSTSSRKRAQPHAKATRRGTKSRHTYVSTQQSGNAGQ